MPIYGTVSVTIGIIQGASVYVAKHSCYPGLLAYGVTRFGALRALVEGMRADDARFRDYGREYSH